MDFPFHNQFTQVKISLSKLLIPKPGCNYSLISVS